ncbi:MAG: hypothetical protein ABI559_12850 [Chloroflexota bacterium]
MKRLAGPAVALTVVGLAVLALVAVGSTTSTQAAFVYQGDVTCDTNVQVDDALAIFGEGAGLAPATCASNGDVDCDGDVDSTDGLLVLKYLGGVPEAISGCTAIGDQIIPGTPTPTGSATTAPTSTALPSPTGDPCLLGDNKDDDYEPNGSGDCAAGISHEVETTGLHLQQDDTHDWYRLDYHNFTDGNCGKQLSIRIAPSAGDVAVQLFTPDSNDDVTTVINDNGEGVQEVAHYQFPDDCGDDSIVYIDVSLAAYPPNADYSITVALS